MLVLIGTDDALLEGLAQLLAGGGHTVLVAHSVDEAEELSQTEKPLLVVVDRATVSSVAGERLAALPQVPGGAIVLYRTTSDQGALTTMPHAVARLTLADLSLPLERQRLAALAQYVKSRARGSGRVRFDTPPERRAP
jgi:DNA-binding NtrC family response regulator